MVKIRFLLHDVFGRAGGVVTVTLGLAEALARTEDVEIVTLFGADREPVHRAGSTLPRTVLIDTTKPPTGREAERLGLHEPSRLIPPGEARSKRYSRHSDRVLTDYIAGLRDGALVTMQPGMSIVSASVENPHIVKVAQDHRPFTDRPGAIRDAYVRHAAGLDAFLTVTAADAARYGKLLGDATRVSLMPNGAAPYAGPPATLDSKLVLAAGRLERSKGFDLLVEAWATVADKHPEWMLHIYGAGTQRPALRSQIAALGLADHVRLPGFSTQLQERMAEAALFVLSSRAEGYGMVLVEAMACGVPVVSTNAPFGPAEIISHGVDGLLVPNQDVAALAEGLLQMIEMPLDERRTMGAAARAKAGERSYDVVTGQWRRLLAECEDARRRRQRPRLLARVRERQARPAATGPAERKAEAVERVPRNRVGLVLNPPSAPERERTYVVFGTRRGGTSMVAGVARALGLDLGDPGSRKNNEDPRFQSRPVQQIREAIARRNAEAPVWGWKYPAAAGYLPEVYQELRNPYFVVVYRDPVAAALSQQRLDRPDNARTERLALHESTSNNALNTGFVLAADRPCLLISNERALLHPKRLVNDVADFLQVPRPEAALRQRILAYIEPGQYKSFEEFFPA